MITENKFIKKLESDKLPLILDQVINKLETISDWNVENLTTATNELLTDTNTKPAQLFSIIRISVSFAPFSPALPDTLKVLGKETTLSRLRKIQAELTEQS